MTIVTRTTHEVTRALLLGSTGLLLALVPQAVFGQAQPMAAPNAAPAAADAAPPPEAPAGTPPLTQKDVEEIIVTGSSIRGVAPVGSQLIGVTRDTILTNAPANTKELLANVPQLGNFGTNAEQSTSNRFRTAGYQPNIHNVGIYATLTLFNGHRFAPVGGEAVFPDPSIIPVIAVQRVEVVADGGSAIYGSDAVAGVVNFIYRKNVEGVEASGTYGWNGTRYRKYDGSIIAGHSWSTGNITAAYEYSQNKSPLNTDIDFLALGGDQTSRGGRDLRGTNCLLPNVTITTIGGDPRGTNYAYGANGQLTAGQNKCGILDPATIIPDSHRHSALVTAHQELGDHVDLWAEVNYSNYQTQTFGGQSNLTLRIPSTNPYYSLGIPAGVNPATVAGGFYLVRRSALGLLNSRHPSSIQYSKVWGVTLGADIDLGGQWRFTPMVHASKTNDFNSDPELDPVGYEAATNLTTSNALNPFAQASGNSAAVLSTIDDNYRRNNTSSQRLREMQMKADGPLFPIWGGDIRAAVGADLRDEEAVQLQTSGTPRRAAQIFTVRDDDISRTVFAGFGELNVPFVSGQNAKPWLQRLTLSLAGRVDYYKEYGAKFNPKVGLVIEPITGYSLHGSYGTSFVAPNLGLLGHKFGFVGSINSTAGFNYTSPTGQNIKIGNIAGTQAPVYNLYNSGGGNPDLQPEKADTWSIGVDLAPPQIKRFRASVSYYNVTYKNTIYKATMQDVFTNPAFAPYIDVNPTPGVNNAAFNTKFAAETAVSPPEMDVPSYIVWDVIFRSYAINLGKRKFSGLDFDASYDLPTNFGQFSLVANGNLKLVDKQQVLPGTPYSDRLGTDQAPKWKGRVMLNWALDPVNINLAMNYVDGFKYNTGNTVTFPGGIQNVKSWTTFDLVARYSLEQFVKGLSIQGRIVNLFDKDPPFVDIANGYLPSNASPFGRQFEVTARIKF
jgi:iron complex outermembrane receptor protein